MLLLCAERLPLISSASSSSGTGRPVNTRSKTRSRISSRNAASEHKYHGTSFPSTYRGSAYFLVCHSRMYMPTPQNRAHKELGAAIASTNPPQIRPLRSPVLNSPPSSEPEPAESSSRSPKLSPSLSTSSSSWTMAVPAPGMEKRKGWKHGANVSIGGLCGQGG